MVTKPFTVVMRGDPSGETGIEARVAAGLVEVVAPYAPRGCEPGDELGPGQLAQCVAVPLSLERMGINLPGRVSLEHANVLAPIGQHRVKRRFTAR